MPSEGSVIAIKMPHSMTLNNHVNCHSGGLMPSLVSISVNIFI